MNASAIEQALERVREAVVATRLDEALPKFLGWQLFELERARDKNPKIVSLHAAYAIILEELDEVWEEVKKKPGERSEALLVEELVQVAAMCQRAVEDLGLEGVSRPR